MDLFIMQWIILSTLAYTPHWRVTMSQKTLKYCFLKVPLQVLAIPLEVPQQGHPKVHPAPCQRTRDHGGCLTGRADASLLALTWWCVYCVYCDAVSIESTESAEKTEKQASWSFRYTLPKDSQSIWTIIKFRKGKLLWAVHRFPVFTKASDCFQSMNLQQLAYGWWCSFNDLYGCIEARFCDLQAKQIRPEHQLKRVAICSLPCRLGPSRDVSWLVGGLNPSEKY